MALSSGGGVFEIVETEIDDQGLTPLAVYWAGIDGAGFAQSVENPGNSALSGDLKVRVWSMARHIKCCQKFRLQRGNYVMG